MSDKESHVSMESPESSSGLNSENFQAQPADKASMKKPGRRANINVRDSQNMGAFLNPMMADLEKVMAENMKKLDKLEEELLGDQRKKRDESNNLQSHVPKEIRNCKSIDTIMKSLEEIVLTADDSAETVLEVDNSQKKNRQFLEENLSRNSEIIKEKLEARKAGRLLNPVETPKKREPGFQIDPLLLEDTDTSYKQKQAADLELLNENIKIENVNNLTCLANSMSAYLVSANSRRNSGKLKSLTVKVYDAVNLWLSRLFRFHDSSVLFHEQEPEGFIRMCNIVLNYKFKNYKEEGYKAFKKQPAVYISESSKYALPEYREIIAVQLNLPMSSIKIARVSKNNNTHLDKIDIGLFYLQLKEDIANNYSPIAVVANAGTYNTGQCDDLAQLNALSTTYHIWVHLEGIYLPTLTLYSVPTAIIPVMSGDSITLDFGNLIGVPSLSQVTLYKNRTDFNTFLQPFNNINTTLCKCLPYWCVLQSIGHDGVVARIKNITDMAFYINDILKKYKTYIQILSFKATSETTFKKYTLGEVFVTALSFITFVDLNNPIVIFKCNKAYIKERIQFFADEDSLGVVESEKKEVKALSLKQKLWQEAMSGPSAKEEFFNMIKTAEPEFKFSSNTENKEQDLRDQKPEKSEKEIQQEADIDEYADTLTSWLCDLLNSLHKNIELGLFEIRGEGSCIRYSPMEHANVYATCEYDLYMFDKSLEDIITILDASIKCKATFGKQVKKFANLMSVNVARWAGIGAIRYIPEYLLDKIGAIVKYSDYLRKKREEEEILIKLHKEKEGDYPEPLIKIKEDEINPNNIEAEIEKEFDVGTRYDFDKYIKEIDSVNEEIVKKLQKKDGGFSVGLASDGLKAIKLGMVNDTDAVEKLAFQVQEVGRSIEEESKFIEKMAEIVRNGIEKASEDLRKESENQSVQKGVIRQIPFVSDWINWISPVEDKSIKGRSFNLESGKYETTDLGNKPIRSVKTSEEIIDNDLINLKSDEGLTDLGTSEK